MMDFGYKVFVLGDPKDEYEPLCRAFGVQPFAVGPGMSARINPLDFGPLGDGWDTLDRVEAQRRAGDHLPPLAHPDPRAGRLPVRRRAARPVRAHRRPRRRGRPRPADRLPRRPPHPARDHHPRPVAAARQPHRAAGDRMPVRVDHGSSSTRPACCATPSASWSPGRWPACSTLPPPSPWTGRRRSSRSPCRASNPSATRRWASR